MVEIANMSQWKCALMMTAMVEPSAQIEPFHVSKDNEICFILFFCNCPQHIKSVFFVLLQQLDFRSCWICIRVSKDTNIMIGETFMHLKAHLFDHNHSLHYITLPLALSRFSSLIPPQEPEGFGLLDTVIIYKWTILQSGNWCMWKCGCAREDHALNWGEQ